MEDFSWIHGRMKFYVVQKEEMEKRKRFCIVAVSHVVVDFYYFSIQTLYKNPQVRERTGSHVGGQVWMRPQEC